MPKLIDFNKRLNQTDDSLLNIERRLENVVKRYTDMLEITIKMDKQLKENQESYSETAKAVKKTNDNLDVLAQSMEEEQKIVKKTTDIIAKARAERSENGKEMQKAQILRQEQNKKIKEEIKLRGAQEGSIKRIRQENRKLRDERDNLNPLLAENIDKIAELNEQIEFNDTVIRESSDAYTQQKINIGNYQSALDALPGPLQNVAGGVQGIGAQLKALLANPIVAIFALIAGAVIAVGKALMSTRDGANGFKRAMNGVTANLDIAKKRFREFATNAKNIFSKEGLNAEVNKLKEGWKQFKDDIGDKGFWKTVGDNAKAAGEAHQEAAQKFRDEAKALKEVKNQLLELRDAYIDIENESRTRIANLQAEADILAITADDDTKSMAQMIAAREQLRIVDLQRTQEAAKLASERMKIAELEIQEAIIAGDIRKTAAGELISITKDGIEIEKNYTDVRIEAIEASNEVLRVEAENAQKRRMIELDVFEQRLDLLLDIGDATKTVNEQIIADTEQSLDFRNEKLKETQKVIDESFQDQIDLFNDFHNINLDVNKLLTLNNNEIVTYAEGLQISERATNRLREVIVERKKAQQDLNTAEKELNREANERIKAAEETMRGIEKDRLRRATDNLERLKELEIEWETERFERLLENDLLLAEEREALKLEHEERLFEIEEEFRKKSEDAEKDQSKKTQAIRRQEQQAAQNLINEGFNFFTTNLDNQLAVLENNYQREIELAGDNAQLKEAIDKRYAEERNRIERQRAITDKAQGVFNAIINTAVAVTKALATSPLLAGLIGALGAAQVASIIAQPIPKFEHGTGKHGVGKDTLAEVAENGPELIMTENGPWLAEKRQYTYLKKGDRVIPNRDTAEWMVNEQGGMTAQKLDQLIHLEKNRQKKQSVHNTNINGSKFHKTVDYGNSRIEFENEYFGH